MILAIGEIAYAFGWFVAIVNLIAHAKWGNIAGLESSTIFAWVLFPWLGWWIRRACCAKFGLFFTSNWEFPKVSQTLSEVAGGVLLKFWGQLLLLLAIGVVLSYIP